MKKIIALALAVMMALSLVCVASAEKTTYKIGILAPAVTHGWVGGVAYHAEQRCKELAGEVEYKLYTSTNAEEMTAQLDDLKTWGAQAIVAFPQWEGMEVPIQAAINEGIYVVNFDIDIAAEGVYKVTGDNEGMGVEGAKYIVDKIGTEAGRKDIKAITGGGGCQEYFQIIADSKDINACSALYSPLMVKDAVDAALALLKGETVDAVKVIPTTIVDRTNVDQYLDPNNTVY